MEPFCDVCNLLIILLGVGMILIVLNLIAYIVRLYIRPNDNNLEVDIRQYHLENRMSQETLPEYTPKYTLT